MFERILLPVDGSVASKQALDYALLIADRFDAEIHALYVIDDSEIPKNVDQASLNDQLETELQDSAGTIIRAVVDAKQDTTIPVIEAMIRGPPVEAILTYAEENKIGLAVLGTHTPSGIIRYLRESVAEQVAQHAQFPVLTIRERKGAKSPEIGQILLATDGSETARRASEFAFELADAFDAYLRGLYVVESRFGSTGMLHRLLSEEGEKVLRELEASSAQAGVDIDTLSRQGSPTDTIIHAASEFDVDLIIVGTQGKTGLDRLVIGSVAANIVRRADRPVLTVRKSDV